jgi:hypothetical protein
MGRVIPDPSTLCNLTTIGNNLVFRSTGLTSVDGLSGNTSMGSRLLFGSNPAPTNVDGLANITSVRSDLGTDGSFWLNRCSCGLFDLLAIPGIIGGPSIIHAINGARLQKR